MLKFKFELSKKNGLLIQQNIFKYPYGLILFIQDDLNIWWKPRIIKNRNTFGYSIGWLFLQLEFSWFNNKNKGELIIC